MQIYVGVTEARSEFQEKERKQNAVQYFAIADWNDESTILVRLMKILCLELAKKGATFYLFIYFLLFVHKQ